MSLFKKCKYLIGIILVSLFLTACGDLSTDELSVKVQDQMQEKFDASGIYIKVNKLTLVEKSNNEYSGILETTEDNGIHSYQVDVLYDGENLTWNIKS